MLLTHNTKSIKQIYNRRSVRHALQEKPCPDGRGATRVPSGVQQVDQGGAQESRVLLSPSRTTLSTFWARAASLTSARRGRWVRTASSGCYRRTKAAPRHIPVRAPGLGDHPEDQGHVLRGDVPPRPPVPQGAQRNRQHGQKGEAGRKCRLRLSNPVRHFPRVVPFPPNRAPFFILDRTPVQTSKAMCAQLDSISTADG